MCLEIGHFHKTFDSLELIFDKQDRLIGYRENEGWPEADFRIWLF